MIPHTLLLAGLFLAAEPPKPNDVAAQARKKVEADVQNAGGKRAVIQLVDDADLAGLFAKHRFVTARFPLWPVAIAPPKGLKSSNVFAVPDEGEPVVMTDPDSLKSFFAKNLLPIKDEAGGKSMTRAWLRLSYEFAQDGFFKFAVPDKEIKSLGESDGVRSFTGKAVVEQTGGNKGDITATLFVVGNKLNKVEEKRNVIAGPRPRCQALKLLDPDPVVRSMAEDTLRIMGRAAKPYLDEQRAKAGPELQKAIDRIWQRIVEEDR